MPGDLDLGCFSVALWVQELDASVRFYEALGFEVLGGGDDWRILGNGSARVGLFERTSPGVSLTFNPGLAQDWPDQPGVNLPAGPGGERGRPLPKHEFPDVRVVEQRLLDAGVSLDRRTSTPEGPDHLLVTDPDGNQILVDQYF